LKNEKFFSEIPKKDVYVARIPFKAMVVASYSEISMWHGCVSSGIRNLLVISYNALLTIIFAPIVKVIN
jgi:hypothetical protein